MFGVNTALLTDIRQHDLTRGFALACVRGHALASFLLDNCTGMQVLWRDYSKGSKEMPEFGLCLWRGRCVCVPFSLYYCSGGSVWMTTDPGCGWARRKARSISSALYSGSMCGKLSAF